jgi:hypothetical protein
VAPAARWISDAGDVALMLKLTADHRRGLELLAGSSKGCAESVMLAVGIRAPWGRSTIECSRQPISGSRRSPPSHSARERGWVCALRLVSIAS